MTNYRYLNDSSELEYAMQLVRDKLKKILNDTNLTECQKEFSQRLSSLTALDDAQIFVSCFSETSDSLEQWRGYGSGTGGFCIEIDPWYLLLSDGDFHLRKVLYDNAKQVDIIDNVLKSYLNVCVSDDFEGKSEHGYNNWMPFLIKDMAETVRDMSTWIKHPAFAMEKEWRIIRHLSSYDEKFLKTIQFRAAGRNLIPYVCFPLRSNCIPIKQCDPALAIKSVVVGPSENQALNVKSVEMLLQKCEMKIAGVTTSTIPFRSL